MQKICFDSLKKVLHQFQVQDVAKITTMDQAIYNQVFLVTTDRQVKYILTKYFARGFQRQWPRILYLLQQLQARNVTVPQFLRDGQNRVVHVDQSHHQYTLAPYFTGYSLNSSSQISPGHCKLAAKWLAVFHAQQIAIDDTDYFSESSLVGWLQQLLQGKTCVQNAKFLSVDLSSLSKDLQDLSDALRDYVDFLPRGWMHNDFFGSNVIFYDNDRINGVIDWEFADYHFWWLDLLIALHAWTFDDQGHVQPLKVQAWWQGFMSGLSSHTSLAITASRREKLRIWTILGKLSCYRLILMRLYNYHLFQQNITQYYQILQYYNEANLTHLEPVISM